MTNLHAVSELEAECQALFSKLASLQNEIRKSYQFMRMEKTSKVTSSLAGSARYMESFYLTASLWMTEKNTISFRPLVSVFRLKPERAGTLDGNKPVQFLRLKEATAQHICYSFT